VSKIRSIKEINLEQRISDEIVVEVVLSTIKSKDFCVKPEVSLEDKIYL